MVWDKLLRTDKPDPRVNAYRKDLADQALKGKVSARYWAKGAPYRVTAAATPLLKSPQEESEAVSELRFGEEVLLFEKDGDWAWVQNLDDHYVGYMRFADLTMAADAGKHPATHRIKAVSTPLFDAPDLKSPVIERLYLHSAVRVTRKEGDYAHIEGPDGGGWIYTPHLAGVNETEPDFVATALKLVNTPYIWGGRTPRGIDCSGLVQLSLNRAGIACPRDSDMQQAAIGTALNADISKEPHQRGDIIFMPGHVGIMVDGKNLLHANAHHMKTCIEPLEDVLARISPENKAKTPNNDGITLRRRIHAAKPQPKEDPEPAGPSLPSP